jgi:hypothetical protein
MPTVFRPPLPGVMPLNSMTAPRVRRVAHALGSGALEADATQTSLCAYLSVIALAGVRLNAALGWWWADTVAALAMVPIIGKEGMEGLIKRPNASATHLSSTLSRRAGDRPVGTKHTAITRFRLQQCPTGGTLPEPHTRVCRHVLRRLRVAVRAADGGFLYGLCHGRNLLPLL